MFRNNALNREFHGGQIIFAIEIGVTYMNRYGFELKHRDSLAFLLPRIHNLFSS